MFFQAEDGIRDLVRSRGLGDVYKRQQTHRITAHLERDQHDDADQHQLVGTEILAGEDRGQVIEYRPVQHLSLIHI